MPLLSVLSKLSPSPDGSIPLLEYGQVSCGFPSPAMDHSQPELSLDELVGLGPTSSVYLLRAWGDSMKDVGIYDGDVLIVDKARESKRGDIVVAVVDAEFVVKAVGRMPDGRPALLPANKRYSPIPIDDEAVVEVWGVVIWNLHKLAQ